MPTPTASSSLTRLAPPAPSQPPVDTPHFSSNNPSSSRLSTALHLKQSLLDRLEAAQTQLHLLHNLQQRHTERQQRVEDETSQERRARKAREQDEIRDKRGQVARERERRATKERVKEALDASHLTTLHLNSLSGPPSRQQSETANLLARRDALSLSLLRAQSSLRALESKKLHVLNRDNAERVRELREAKYPGKEAVKVLPQEVQDYYASLQDSHLILSTRFTILSNVFTRLVAESGVSFLPSSPSPSYASLLSPSTVSSSSSSATAHPPPLTSDRLLSLLLLAGSPPSPSAFDDENIDTAGERLPEPQGEVMRQWRKQEASERALREGGEEGRGRLGKRTRTV